MGKNNVFFPKKKTTQRLPLNKYKTLNIISKKAISKIFYNHETIISVLEKVRRSFLLGYIPKTMPGREIEKQRVYEFVSEFVCSGGRSDAHLYVSGVPGTGKTAILMQVLKELF